MAEAIGTFALVFAGAGAGAIVVDARTHALGHVGVAITVGLVIIAMIYAVGHVSGAHFNPAVTFAFAVTRQFPWTRALAYWVAQVGAAIAAFLLLRASLGHDAHLGATLPAMFGGPITGASMNPARSIGPGPCRRRPPRSLALRRRPDRPGVSRRVAVPIRERRASTSRSGRRRGGGSVSDVLFICVANPGRSVMAEQIFNRTAGGRLYATLAGSEPGTAAHPAVIEALVEIGIDASDHRSSTPTRSRASMQWFRRAVKKPVP